MPPLIFRIIAFGYRDKDKTTEVELFSRIFAREYDARTFAEGLLKAEGSIRGTVTVCCFQKIRIEEQEMISPIPTISKNSDGTFHISGPVTPTPYAFPIESVIQEIPVRNRLGVALEELTGGSKTATEELDRNSQRFKCLNRDIPGYPTYAELIASPDPVQLLGDYAAKRAGKITQLPGTRKSEQEVPPPDDFDPDSPSIA